jgi:hypothetical protein
MYIRNTKMALTQNSVASTIAGTAMLTEKLMHMVCDDIDEAKFATRFGTTINHPAFVLGHVAYYFGVCIEILGGEVTFGENESAVYIDGIDCIDDAAIYQNKEDSIAHYKARLQEALDYVASCDEKILSRSADGTPFNGRLETFGQIASFMLTVHPAFHIGQLSAWRRVAGMGSAR